VFQTHWLVDTGLLENKDDELQCSLESWCSEWGSCGWARLLGRRAAGLRPSGDLAPSCTALLPAVQKVAKTSIAISCGTELSRNGESSIWWSLLLEAKQQ